MEIDPWSTNYIVILALTCVVLTVKLILILYLGRKIHLKNKDANVTSSGLINAFFIVLIALFISRIFFSIFDFDLTYFNILYYTNSTNIWFWKIAIVISGLGYLYLMLFVDKKILQNKFKGIFAYLFIAGLIFIIVYSPQNSNDFSLMSTILAISMIGVIMIPLVFLYMAIKTPGEVRRTALTVFMGLALYLIGTLAVNEGIVGLMVQYEIVLYIISTACKSLGLILITIGATKLQI
jgi:hypothetical protein